MKAAVCREFGKPLLIEGVHVNGAQVGEVVVQVNACAVCHSDVHYVRGDWTCDLPFVAGHEAAGVVVNAGDGVRDLQTGDHVVATPLRSCGYCFQCRRGTSYCCETKFALDWETRITSPEGEPILQGVRTAAFAEYIVVDQSQVVKVPHSLASETACLLGCGVITGVGAVVNTARVEVGSTVAIIGGGGVGLNSIQGAVLCGASEIIAVDVRDQKLDVCQRFGATQTINASREDPVGAVRDITQGVGLDYVFIAVGSARVVHQGSRMLRPGGALVIVGMPPNEDVDVTFNSHDLSLDRSVRGSLMGSTNLATDIPRLVSLYQNGRLKLDELISGRFTLSQINQAMDSTENGDAIRNVVVFE